MSPERASHGEIDNENINDVIVEVIVTFWACCEDQK
jgi:hypothetical protein